MDGKSQDYLDEFSEEDLEDMKEDDMEEQMELSQEFNPDSPYPLQDEKHNQFTFLHKAAFESNDTIRTTWLSESELGRPLFSVRFLLDLHKMAHHDNLHKIAEYYLSKVQNITHSGMSNKGFAMNLNVTQKRDATKTRIRDTSGLKNQPNKQKSL